MDASIEDVLARRTAEWMAVPGVAGTGIGIRGGVRCLVVFVIERNAEIERRVPEEADGFPVRIEVGGRAYRRQ
jgi:hypothetical protein